MINEWHVRLFLVNTMIIGPWWNSEELARIYWRLYLDDSDGASVTLRDGTVVPLNAGQVFLLPEDVTYRSRCRGDVVHHYLHFDVLGIPHTVQQSLFSGPFALPAEANARIAERIRALPRVEVSSGETRIAAQCAAKAVLYEALWLRLAALPEDELAQILGQAQILAPVQPALQHVADHLADPLPVADLAALCCLSDDHFIRRFRECVGQTPARYIQEQRVLQAAQLLLFTDYTIERIVGETGFGNRHYFSRIFKRHTGQSPAAYRNSGAT